MNGEYPRTYSWNFNGGAIPNTSGSNEPVVELQNAGTYSVQLIVNNSYGQDSYQFELVVTPNNNAPVISSIEPVYGYEGQIIDFYAEVTGSLPITYDWDFGGAASPNSSTDIRPEVILLTPNNYTVSLTATNSFGSDLSNQPFEIRNGRGEWIKERLGTIDQTAALIYQRGHSIRFDNENRPIISYPTFAGQWQLRLAIAEPPANWEQEELTFSPHAPDSVSLAVSDTGQPWIGYCNGWDIHVSTYNDGWSTWIIYPNYSGDRTRVFNSIAVGPDGKPWIAFFDGSKLRYSKFTGSSWTSSQYIDSNAGVGHYCCMKFDSSGNPAVAYYDTTNEILKYAYWTGTSFAYETAIPPDHGGNYCSLAFDNDTPYIAFWGGVMGLSLVSKSGGSWGSIFSIDNTCTPFQSEIDIDDDGNMAIVCCNVDAVDYENYVPFYWYDSGVWHRRYCDVVVPGGIGSTSMSFDNNGVPWITWVEESEKQVYEYWYGVWPPE